MARKHEAPSEHIDIEGDRQGLTEQLDEIFGELVDANVELAERHIDLLEFEELKDLSAKPETLIERAKKNIQQVEARIAKLEEDKLEVEGLLQKLENLDARLKKLLMEFQSDTTH